MIDNEKKAEIFKAYQDRSIRTKEICERYRVNGSFLAKIVVEQGGEEALRRPSRSCYRTKARKCPKCGATIKLDGARFCPFCACDIRSEKDIIIERLRKLHELTETLPSNDRDNFRDTINQTIAFIRKENR